MKKVPVYRCGKTKRETINKPPERVARQHTWEAFFILRGDGDFFPPPLIFLFLLQQVL